MTDSRIPSPEHISKVIKRTLPEYKTQAQYSAIFRVLTEYCKIHQDLWESFIQAFGKGYPLVEYRFQGNLGFGGKLYQRRDGTHYVAQYTEDETRKSKVIVAKVNKLIKTIDETYK